MLNDWGTLHTTVQATSSCYGFRIFGTYLDNLLIFSNHVFRLFCIFADGISKVILK